MPEWFLNPWYPTILSTVALLSVAEYLSHDLADLVLLPFYILVSIYGSFNLFVFLDSWKNGSFRPEKLDYLPQGSITYMYLTYNDFSLDSFRTVIRAARPADSILIVDDSTDPESKSQVDMAAEMYSCKVIRRDKRSGFKAGAINNAMMTVNTDFVSIIDADETVPETLLRQLFRTSLMIMWHLCRSHITHATSPPHGRGTWATVLICTGRYTSHTGTDTVL